MKERKPAFEHRLNHIRVTVWENASEEANWYTTTITRRYKSSENGDWKDSNAFTGLADVALAAEGLRLAQEFITERATKATSHRQETAGRDS